MKTISPLYTSTDFHRIGYQEDDKTAPHRSPFRRDYTRLIHSASFRRLQRKTQLFPGENDFFRNRLTHSLEVAQIAKSIAERLNAVYIAQHLTKKQLQHQSSYFISTDLVEFAALAHDIGHPPFGHNGEHALKDCMAEFGGFEGNAQSLRIITRLIKKSTSGEGFIEFDKDGNDLRLGVNPTFRSVASILKYDEKIRSVKPGHKIIKGYYEDELDVVENTKRALLGEAFASSDVEFKVVECQIMDLADDIAYTCYDLEDAMKAGFTNPLDIRAKSEDKPFIAKFVVKQLARSTPAYRNLDPDHAIPQQLKAEFDKKKDEVSNALNFLARFLGADDNQTPVNAYKGSLRISGNGYRRTATISSLVAQFINSVELKYNSENPAFSDVRFREPRKSKNGRNIELTETALEILKAFTHEVHIQGTRLKSIEHRGKKIVSDIFGALDSDADNMLLAPRFKAHIKRCDDERIRKRVICDYVAGMSDRFALEFYEKLFSSNPSTIFK